MLDKEDYDRLVDIRVEMMDLLEEAKNIIRMSGNRSVYERAKSYWIGHVDAGLGEGNYVDTYEYTMAKTIAELDPVPEEELEEEWDDAPVSSAHLSHD